mmetsp:Transcript_47514/g.132465  ORF Transcript_47514/g.132465 Transcript_47514/m.132465 type:complete len:215 (-) Transcript_47514:2081-2725(-)
MAPDASTPGPRWPSGASAGSVSASGSASTGRRSTLHVCEVAPSRCAPRCCAGSTSRYLQAIKTRWSKTSWTRRGPQWSPRARHASSTCGWSSRCRTTPRRWSQTGMRRSGMGALTRPCSGAVTSGVSWKRSRSVTRWFAPRHRTHACCWPPKTSWSCRSQHFCQCFGTCAKSSTSRQQTPCSGPAARSLRRCSRSCGRGSWTSTLRSCYWTRTS